MEEKIQEIKNRDITFQEAMEAQEKYRDYLKRIGRNPFSLNDNMTEPPKSWPEDIKEAWYIHYFYNEQQEEDGIIA